MTRARRAATALALAVVASLGVALAVAGLMAAVAGEWRRGLTLVALGSALVALPVRAVRWINARNQGG